MTSHHACIDSRADRQPVAPPAGPGQTRVAAYYDEKTAAILRKYGPGPQVHFHLGLYEGPVRVDGAAAALRARLTAAQTALMDHASRRWDAPRAFAGRLLDVGCGLGGGALYWAERSATEVTAITIAEAHIPVIAQLAAWAGVGERVRPVLADALTFDAPRPFDAAVALESSCYLDRDAWFARLAALVRPGGMVCIEDTFLGDPAWRTPFDAYWHTRIGTPEEYASAARAHGFALRDEEDITARTTPFWCQSIAWTKANLAAETDREERGRLIRSISWHEQFLEAWRQHRIRVLLLRLERL